MANERPTTRKKINPTNAFSTIEGGKLPPQAPELEQAVLGALLIDKNAVAEVIDLLHEKCFYVESNQKIYKAIISLFHDTKPIDILTVTQKLRSMGELEIVGGAVYITQLTNRVASAANIEFHSRVILQKFIQRELIRISTETIKDAFEETTDVLELLDRSEKNLFSITESNIRRNYEDMHTLVGRALEDVANAATLTDGVTGVPSGFTELDRHTMGWQKSDLIIIAARPGMGKTAFTLSLAKNAALDGKKPVAFFSLEMSSLQLVNRLISSETEITSEKLRKGDLNKDEWARLNVKVKRLTDAPIYIDDTPALSILELRAKCRRLVAEKKIELIVIDYLQLMSGGAESGGRGGNREQEISYISRSLKSIAKELSIPIIALSQLSRAVETRGSSKRPQLSDLRESGAIEQDADMVMFIYRPEYYQLETLEDGTSTKNLAEIIIAKNRAGSLGDVRLQFIGPLTKFSDYNHFDYTDETEIMHGAGMSPNYSADSGSNTIIIESRINEQRPDDAEF
jgi:replicative DNA helicase